MPSPNQAFCTIVPPHMLRGLLEQPDPALRELALRTLSASVRIRERRSLLSSVPPRSGVSAGELRRTLYDARHGWQLPGVLVRGERDPETRDPAVNEAFDGLGDTYRLYSEIYQRNSLDDRGHRLDATVHYGERYANAFWDGQQMVFGDGDGRIFAGFTRALDVVAHELSHGVVQHTANLEYHGQSGALNESFADVFGSLAKQYKAKQAVDAADWLIGDQVLAAGIRGRALRSLKEPGTAYDDPKLGGRDPQPGRMSEYVELPDSEDGDWGGVHYNSGILNRAFYLVAASLGGYAWEDAGHLWYEALKRLWERAQFRDCANVSFEVAGRLHGSGSRAQLAVGEAWTEVGVPVDDGGARPRRERKRRDASDGTAELRQRLERLGAAIDDVIEALA